MSELAKFDPWLTTDTFAALVIREYLEPVEGPEGVLFPATYAAAEDKKVFVDRERKAIEAALAECQGRVSGPRGAAAVLGIPHQTLESKIVSLGIDKGRFKVVD